MRKILILVVCLQFLCSWSVYAAGIDDWQVKDHTISQTQEGIIDAAQSLAEGNIVYNPPIDAGSFEFSLKINKIAGYNPNIDHWINFSLLNKPEYFLGSQAKGLVVLIRPLSESKTRFELHNNAPLKMLVAKELDLPPVGDFNISFKNKEQEWIFAVNGTEIPVSAAELDPAIFSDGKGYLSMGTSGNGDLVEFIVGSINGQSLAANETVAETAPGPENTENTSNNDAGEVKEIGRFGPYQYALAAIVLVFGIPGAFLLLRKTR